MTKEEREKLREIYPDPESIAGAQIKALLDHIDALEGQIEKLKPVNFRGFKGGTSLCHLHGGYCFPSDCAECNGEIMPEAAIASAPEVE